MNLAALALRNVARNRRRSLLTGGVVVVGFTAFALAGGFMAQSLEGLSEGTIRNGIGHLQLADAQEFAGGGTATLEHGLERAEELERIVREDPAVLEVLPRIDFVGLLTSGTRSVPFLGTGLDPAPEARTMDQPKTLAAGRWLHDRSERGVVLGSGLAAALGTQVGEVVTLLATTPDGTLNAVDATVVALADIPIKELDDRFCATSLDLAGELLGASDRVSRLVVVLRDRGAAHAALERLRQRLAGSGFHVEGKTWDELAVFYRQVRLLYLGIFGFMGTVLVVVVLLAATNTMLMAAAERTREIGTLRALGTRPAAIRRMFVIEGALLAAAACAAGAVASLLLRQLLNHSGIVLPPPPGVTHGMPLHVEFYAAAYVAGALAMFATLMLASYVPARRAAKLPIVEALAHV
ncbi:MAG TPA: FtsX-like permease family protein [Candidatus Polarisedimenticolaceae bacterium]|nr:FtsX-like permease family protein [Candidatus Polarisedimenticolaceae bacterium]